MKIRIIASALALTAISSGAYAQSAVDAIQIAGDGELRGTARFTGMGGAMTALGGDLSAIRVNPAGIGAYRHSDIGITLDVGFRNVATDIPPRESKAKTACRDSKTKAACNNFGYAGVAKLNGALKTFGWSASYNRLQQFDRVTRGYAAQTPTSLTNYIASYSNSAGYTPGELGFDNATKYNPYQDSNADWLSILAYTTYGMNMDNGKWVGLHGQNTVGDALLEVHEKGYADQYDFNFGGNVDDVVYWGVGFGITDLQYTRTTAYSESLEDARIYNYAKDDGVTTGAAGYWLDSYKHISGTGFNIKAGVIILPVNEFRIGLAFETPTWWSLQQTVDGRSFYQYSDPRVNGMLTNLDDKPGNDGELTDVSDFNWRLASPWRMNIGVAGVIDRRLIISGEYERLAYNNMSVSTPRYDYYGYTDGYDKNEEVTQDIKNYYKAGNILRVGAELRVTDKISLRAGYNLNTSNSKVKVGTQVVTAGLDPSFSTSKTANTMTLGVGVKFGAFYVDGAYAFTQRKSVLHAYTDFDGLAGPQYDVTDNFSQAVVSVGYRF